MYELGAVDDLWCVCEVFRWCLIARNERGKKKRKTERKERLAALFLVALIAAFPCKFLAEIWCKSSLHIEVVACKIWCFYSTISLLK